MATGKKGGILGRFTEKRKARDFVGDEVARGRLDSEAQRKTKEALDKLKEQGGSPENKG